MKLLDLRPESHTTDSSSTHQSHTLETIRKNCILNCSLRLASEEVVKTKPLSSFAKQSFFPKRAFAPTVLPKLVTYVRTSKKDIDLTNTTLLQKEGLSVAYSCFHCPSVGLDKKSRTRDLQAKDAGDPDAFLADGEGESDVEEEAGGGQMDHRRFVFIDPHLAAFNVVR